MKEYIVKVKNNKDKDYIKLSSGFIYFPNSEIGYVYIITARHSLVELNQTIKKENITIQFFDKNKTEYKLTGETDIIVGANDETEDFAIIKLPVSIIPSSIQATDGPKLVQLTGKEKEFRIIGIPKATDNEHVRSLLEVTLLPDKDFENQMQLHASDPISEHYNTNVLYEGYSGSPIFVSSVSGLFVVGIFLGYETSTKRILGIDLAIINNKSSVKLEFNSIETDWTLLEDISKIKANSQRILNRIRNKIGDTILERSDIKNSIKNIISSNSLILITGNAGTGKSAITKQAILELDSEYESIALQGEQLDKGSISEIFSEKSIGIQNDFETVLNSIGLKPRKILFLDSIEKLLETSNAGTIIDFFTLLKSRNDLKIVLTCRSYAVEQLKIRFLQKFSKFEPFNVPFLTDPELGTICIQYPFIKSLLQKNSLKPVLQIPFNLDKATMISAQALSENVTSEGDFKKLVWEYIVENRDAETDPNNRKNRGMAFQEIAVQRAMQMTSYVKPSDAINQSIIYKLKQDDILEENPAVSGYYAVAHDIYEDWALTRFIDEAYLRVLAGETQIVEFFTTIGYSPASRRSFRIWISEKIKVVDYDTRSLLQEILKSTTIALYWKDEVIIAVLQSAYSADFLNDSKRILFDNEFFLFKRCLLLLNVACQIFDEIYLPFLKEENASSYLYQSAYLKPDGLGWSSMINFIACCIDDLECQFQLIVPLLCMQWKKTLHSFRPLPEEARHVGLILLRYLSKYRSDIENQETYTRDEYMSDVITTLFLITPVIKEEIADLLNLVLNTDDKTVDYRIRSINNVIKEKVLSWSHSTQLCRELPSLVINMARTEWFYYPPTPEHLEAKFKDYPFKSLPHDKDKNEEFGVTDDYRRDYFPASSYQTPIHHLLWNAPKMTLAFIVQLFNHSAEEFQKSDFLLNDSAVFAKDERVLVSYTLSDGTIVQQFGCLTLWVIYRGIYIATPYLLQSVLMALEKYLLELCELASISQDKKGNTAVLQRIDYAFDYLLKESKSVSTTAVLMSIAFAYRDLVIEKIFPLLEVKEIYLWDLLRSLHERSALAPLGVGENAQLLQNERFASNNLPHRKEQIEVFILNLSTGKYSERIFQILDKFYAENSSNESWRLVLNRMDRRRYNKVVAQTENGFLVQPEVDEDLLPIVKEAEDYNKTISLLNAATVWADTKLKSNIVNKDDYTDWQVHLKNIEGNNLSSKDVGLWNNPTLLAAVGIKCYFDILTKKERDWCVNQVFSNIEHELHNRNVYDFEYRSVFNPFGTKAAYTSLIDLVFKASGQDQVKAKEKLFLCLVFIENKFEKEDLAQEFKSKLWMHSPDFASACVYGLIEYSKIAQLRFAIERTISIINENHLAEEKSKDVSSRRSLKALLKGVFHIGKQTRKKILNGSEHAEIKEIIFEYETKFKKILTSVVNENIQSDFATLPDTRSAFFYLLSALFLIPEHTLINELQEYFLTVLTYVSENINKGGLYDNENIPFEYQSKFETVFARFLLSQPHDVALTKFKHLVDPYFECESKFSSRKYELIEHVLENILDLAVKDDALVANFWILWQYLLSISLKSKNEEFFDILLLDYSYWNPESREWSGITNKKSFFEKFAFDGPIKPMAKLLSGVGYKELLPEGILWISHLIKSQSIDDKHVTFYLEKLITNAIYDSSLRKTIRNNSVLREGFISLLDKLIDNNSASAFLIREDFISSRN